MVFRRAAITLLIGCGVGLGQQNGRFASLKSQAFEAFDRGQFDQVAGKLEEIWEQDQTDPKVAEYLAMGYLYGERRADKARPLMKAAIAKGGQATFMVRHSHERAGILSGDIINNYCSGRMSITADKIAFISEIPDHSVTFTLVDLKSFRILGGSPGRVEIKSHNKTHIFRVKSESTDEANLLQEIASESLKK